MDLIEYLAMLVTPHPKEAMKVIQERKKEFERTKLKMGELDKDEVKKKLYFEDHRSTTFYDELMQHGGEQAAKEPAMIFQDDLENTDTYEVRDMDIEDMEFMEHVKATKEKIDQKKQRQQSFDTIEF